MSNSISQSFQPSGIEVFRRKGKDEPSNVSKIYGSVLFVLSLAGTVFLTLSLATFSGMDPGFSMANSFSRISNVFGVAGAWVADLLYLLFGWSAWLLVAGALFTLIRSGQMFFNGIYPYKYPNGLRVVAFFLLIVASSTLFFLRLHSFSSDLPGTSGGAIGSAVGTVLLTAVGLNISTVIVAVLAVLSFGIFFNFSWIELMESIGKGCESVLMRLRKTQETKEDEEEGIAQRKLREEKLSHNRETAPAKKVAPRKVPVPSIPNKVERSSIREIKKDPIIITHHSVTEPIPPEPEQTKLQFEETPNTDALLAGQVPPEQEQKEDFVLPTSNLLEVPPYDRPQISEEEVTFTSDRIEHILATYKIKAKVLSAMRG
ncbi:DNA translocase FtsK 4TM domain-containing protein, partial [Turicimonas muris]